MTRPVPLRDNVLVTILPKAQRSSVLVTPERETPIRRARIEAVGPDAPFAVGTLVLVNILAGQQFGEEMMVLPKSSIVAEWDE